MRETRSRSVLTSQRVYFHQSSTAVEAKACVRLGCGVGLRANEDVCQKHTCGPRVRRKPIVTGQDSVPQIPKRRARTVDVDKQSGDWKARAHKQSVRVSG